MLYTTYVWPQLKFAIAVWNSYPQRDTKKLEKVHNRAIKVPHFLKGFNLTSLSVKRTRGDLIQKYKRKNNIKVINKPRWNSYSVTFFKRNLDNHNKLISQLKSAGAVYCHRPSFKISHLNSHLVLFKI